MIFTDQNGSVWISGYMVCKDAFPIFPSTFWWPWASVPGASGTIVSGQISCAPAKTGGHPLGCSPDPDISQPPAVPSEPNPFYQGYDLSD